MEKCTHCGCRLTTHNNGDKECTVCGAYTKWMYVGDSLVLPPSPEVREEYHDNFFNGLTTVESLV